ncbi:MAG TPA: BspA family leucine-rich repeat surface protein [Erysipelothrix sp.]|nr:BspA family leucine-rich repeat surface protein [Erysipelothrix sp.]
MKLRRKKKYRLKKHIKKKLKFGFFVIGFISALFMFTSSFAVFTETKVNSIGGTIGAIEPDVDGMIVYEYDLSKTSYLNISKNDLEDQIIYIYKGTYEANKIHIDEDGFSGPVTRVNNFDPTKTIQSQITFNNGIYTVIATQFTETYGELNNPGLISIPHYDIKKLGTTNLSYMFAGATLFNQDISNWDVSSVKNMKGMFKNASTFNQDIGSWNVDKVENMDDMFYLTYDRFNFDLFNWNPAVETKPTTFHHGVHLNTFNYPAKWQSTFKIIFDYNPYINKQKEITGYFNRSFNKFTLEKAPTVDEFGLENDNSSLDWFANNNTLKFTENMKFTSTDLTNNQIVFYPNIQSIHIAFEYNLKNSQQAYLNIKDISGHTVYVYKGNYKDVLASTEPFLIVSNLDENTNLLDKLRQENLTVNEGDYTFVTTYFKETAHDKPNPSLTGIPHFDIVGLGATNISNLLKGTRSFKTDITSWNVSSITHMNGLFADSNFNQEIGYWNVSNVISMRELFKGTAFKQNINNWDVSNVLDMSGMFQDTNLSNHDTYHVSKWDVSSVKDMSRMFKNALYMNTNLSAWNVSSVENMSEMFRSTLLFNNNIGKWDVSSVKDMTSMFQSSGFNQDIGRWQVNNVESMNYMFYLNLSFWQNLSTWEVDKIDSMPTNFTHNAAYPAHLLPSKWNAKNTNVLKETQNLSNSQEPQENDAD